MKTRLLAAGTRQPAWVGAAFLEYVRRLPAESRLELTEIGVSRTRAQGASGRAVEQEGARMLEHIPGACWVVALAVDGRAYDTAGFARWWARRLQDGRDVTFLIGGPDGLSPACLGRADERLSLSTLTFPHGLARVLLAEQLYRATSLLKGHPYHRA
jgi:23S rRNA (pseudouridine1915-N3)-methyltransferase